MLIIAAAIMANIVMASTLFAESANHRVTLTLSGQHCSMHLEAISQKLNQVAGVKRVEMNLIPDHILIDRVQDQLLPEDFQAIVNALLSSSEHCRAEIMTSCITADQSTRPR